MNRISRTDLHPVSIFCVGKNYSDHALEMAAWEPERKIDPAPALQQEPIIFMKPVTALETGGVTSIPQFNGHPLGRSLHYEAELVLLVGADSDGVSLQDAEQLIAGYGAGLDMTLRDVQLEAKKSGNPWLQSKGFRRSALVSDFIVPASGVQWKDLTIALMVNGAMAQHAPVCHMIFSPPFLVHYLSHLYSLRKGDLIFTGTPAGVGPVNPGDHLEALLFDASGCPMITLDATVE